MNAFVNLRTDLRQQAQHCNSTLQVMIGMVHKQDADGSKELLEWGRPAHKACSMIQIWKALQKRTNA